MMREAPTPVVYRIVASAGYCLAVALFVAVALTVRVAIVTLFLDATAKREFGSLVALYFKGAIGFALVYGPIRAFLPNAAGAVLTGAILLSGGILAYFWPLTGEEARAIVPVLILVGGVGGGLLGWFVFRDFQPLSRYELWVRARGLNDV